jgi:hypothetical protein
MRNKSFILIFFNIQIKRIMTTKMSKIEEHKWMTYVVWAVIIAIFGMVIYLVTMDEKKEDRYWVSLVFVQNNADLDLPVYPNNSTGTLNGGIKTVRDAVASKVDSYTNVDFKVPHASQWKLSIAPNANTDEFDVIYTYSFPASSEMSTTKPFLNEILDSNETVGDIFDQSSADVKSWADTVFSNATPIIAALNYGTRDSIQSGFNFT